MDPHFLYPAEKTIRRRQDEHILPGLCCTCSLQLTRWLPCGTFSKTHHYLVDSYTDSTINTQHNSVFAVKTIIVSSLLDQNKFSCQSMVRALTTNQNWPVRS